MAEALVLPEGLGERFGITSILGILADQEHPLFAAQWADGILAWDRGMPHAHSSIK